MYSILRIPDDENTAYIQQANANKNSHFPFEYNTIFFISENAALVTKDPTSLEHENPITVNKAQTKFQKRGGKQFITYLLLFIGNIFLHVKAFKPKKEKYLLIN